MPRCRILHYHFVHPHYSHTRPLFSSPLLYPSRLIPLNGLSAPCMGLQIPLTPSFPLLTTLPPVTRRFFAPFPSRNSSAFCNICSFDRFRTQMAFVIVVPLEGVIAGEKVEGEVGEGAM